MWLWEITRLEHCLQSAIPRTELLDSRWWYFKMKLGYLHRHIGSVIALVWLAKCMTWSAKKATAWRDITDHIDTQFNALRFQYIVPCNVACYARTTPTPAEPHIHIISSIRVRVLIGRLKVVYNGFKRFFCLHSLKSGDLSFDQRHSNETVIKINCCM